LEPTVLVYIVRPDYDESGQRVVSAGTIIDRLSDFLAPHNVRLSNLTFDGASRAKGLQASGRAFLNWQRSRWGGQRFVLLGKYRLMLCIPFNNAWNVK
jgi:hypothetical protein